MRFSSDPASLTYWRLTLSEPPRVFLDGPSNTSVSRWTAPTATSSGPSVPMTATVSALSGSLAMSRSPFHWARHVALHGICAALAAARAMATRVMALGDMDVEAISGASLRRGTPSHCRVPPSLADGNASQAGCAPSDQEPRHSSGADGSRSRSPGPRYSRGGAAADVRGGRVAAVGSAGCCCCSVGCCCSAGPAPPRRRGTYPQRVGRGRWRPVDLGEESVDLASWYPSLHERLPSASRLAGRALRCRPAV